MPSCITLRARSRRLAAVLLLGVAVVGLSGCMTYRVRHAPPPEREAAVRMPGFAEEVRTWGDVINEGFRGNLAQAFREDLASQTPEATNGPVVACEILAISGGAANGAYGAGLLTGWSQTQTRPRFKIVTGISTGALMAPFAFIGPDCDASMSALYTNVSTREIFIFRFFDLFRMFTRDHAADTRPLRQLAYRCYDEWLIARVAAEHRRGRRLYVGTTALDAQRPVIWDLGAIAASDHPQRSMLFREVLLASAAIPVAFPPVYLEVEAGGEKFDEMHVDGGLINQVFIYDAVWDALKELQRKDRRPMGVRLYVIRNNHLSANWEQVPARLVPIARRSLATITKSNSYGDLFRIYTKSKEHRADFNLAAIPDQVNLNRREEFDREAMRRLYDRGFADATQAGGYPWIKSFDGPPGGLEFFRPSPSESTPPQPQRVNTTRRPARGR